MNVRMKLPTFLAAAVAATLFASDHFAVIADVEIG